MPRNSLALLAVAVGLVGIALAIKGYFGGGTVAPGPAGPGVLAGTPARSFDVKALRGGRGSLAQYRGRVVLLNLWATWCAPCRSETPALERLYRRDHTRGLVVLGVDQGESAGTVLAFVKEMKLTYPVLVDEEQRYGGAYAAIGLPTSILIDPTGRVVRGIDGELTFAQMNDAVDPLLLPH